MDLKEKEYYISNYYLYNTTIEHLWDVFKCSDRYIKIFSEYYSDFRHLKNENNQEKCDQYSFQWKKNITVNAKIEFLKENIDQKKILLVLTGQDIIMELLAQLDLKYISIDKKSLLIWKISIKKGNFTRKQLESLSQEIMDLCRCIETHLNNNINFYSNIESIIIRKKQFLIWKIVTDWDLFKEYSFYLAESIRYEGRKHKVGSKIILNWSSENREIQMLIKSIKNEENNFSWELILELTDSCPKIPSYEIHINVVKISENSSIVHYKHIFKQHIEREFLESLKKEKEKILITLKKNLEDKYD